MRFQREFEQKPLIRQQEFSKNVTFFMRGTSSLFCCFLWIVLFKFTSKFSFLDDVPSIKNVTFENYCYITGGFSSNSLWNLTSFFLKVRFQRKFEQKPLVKQPQFLQNVTFFYAGYIVFFWLFFVKKGKKCENLIIN